MESITPNVQTITLSAEPVAFSLDDVVIYITDDPERNRRTLTLTNGTDNDLKLKGGTPVPETAVSSKSPSSFYLSFGDLLTDEQLKALHITADGWNAEYFDDAFRNWGLCPKQDMTLPAKSSVEFALTNLTAGGRPRPGRLTIDYYNMDLISDNSVSIRLLLQNPPAGRKNLNLLASFVDGDTVYTSSDDGNPIANDLYFTLSNPSPKDPIVPEDTKWEANAPVFTLSLVYGTWPGFGALTTPQLAEKITVGIAEQYGSRWKIVDHKQGSDPWWELKPQWHQILGTGADSSVTFSLNDIISTLPVGRIPNVTLMYLQYANIPGYNDGFLTLHIIRKAGPAITTFRAEPASVPHGETSIKTILHWKTEHADKVSFKGPGLSPAFYAPNGSGPLSTPLEAKANDRFTITAYLARSGNSALNAAAPERPTASDNALTVERSITIISPTFRKVSITAKSVDALTDVLPTAERDKVFAFQTGSSRTRHTFAAFNLADGTAMELDFNQGRPSYTESRAVTVSPDGRTIYSVLKHRGRDQSDQHIHLMTVNTATNEVAKGTDLGYLGGLIIPMNILVSLSSERLYFSFASWTMNGEKPPYGAGGIWILDTKSFEIQKRISWDEILKGVQSSGALKGLQNVGGGPPVPVKGSLAQGLFGISPDERFLFCVATNRIYSYDVESGRTRQLIIDGFNDKGHIYLINELTMSNDGQRIYLYLGCATKELKICQDRPDYILFIDVEPATGAMHISHQLELPPQELSQHTAIALSTDNHTLYAYNRKNNLFIIDTRDGSINDVQITSNGEFAPDGLMAGLEDGVLLGAAGRSVFVVGV